ncbi:DNA (cytosine-5)-methyltransferase 1-like [Arctopsyche grandis]|uniref:DNA (cytosine-5)-methyltransferase 1-like n=1 Tax=Arctopsyche grandis TaxID=121162 RepID=UPI00406D671B
MPVSRFKTPENPRDSIKSPKSATLRSSKKSTIENQNPNSQIFTSKSSKSSRHDVSSQPTLTDMFSKKRPRDEDDVLVSSERNVKPKLDEDVEQAKHENKLDDQNANEKISVVKTVTEDSSIDINGNGKIKDLDSTDKKNSVISTDTQIERCHLCDRNLNDPELKFFYGHPQNAVEEYIALTDENLVLASGDEGDIMDRPHVSITGYSIYDKEGHLCPIDGGLIETDVRLYLSGYLKSICSDSPDIDSDSVPVKEVGPIIEWGIHGFDGGKNNCIIISTEFGEYNLLKPSTEYSCLMDDLYEKISISKVTVEYLEEYHYLLPEYEDLLLVIKESTIPELDNKMITEEMLHKHAKFICDQVVSLEVHEEGEDPLITLPCMRELVKLFGIKFGKNHVKTKIKYDKKPARHTWTKATTTPLVRKTFEMFFSNQLDKLSEKNLVLRRKRCGICDHCQKPDCGQCSSCRAMGKFGGAGKTKKACIYRNCPNMAVEQAEESDPENEDELDIANPTTSDFPEDKVPVKLTGAGVKSIMWLGDSIKSEGIKTFYNAVKIDNLDVKVGDFVMVDTISPTIPHLVTRVVCMWKETMTPKAGYFHGQVFMRSSDTVLGEVSDPREIFLQDVCCNGAPLSSILRHAQVERRDIPKNWFNLGGEDLAEEILEDNGKTYFYQKYYDKIYARFEDLPEDPPCPNPARLHRYCPSCERQNKKYSNNVPKVIEKLEKPAEPSDFNRYEWGAVKWKGFDYRKGGAVFLQADTFKLKSQYASDIDKTNKVDETVYTEHYRKTDITLRGSNVDTVEPYRVGYISAVLARGDSPIVSPQDIFLKVNIMYRPENTLKPDPYRDDLNLVYWSDDQKEIAFSNVVGPCTLMYADNIPKNISHSEWSSVDFSRFYFKEAYNKNTKTFHKVSEYASKVGFVESKPVKAKGKGKGKSSKTDGSTHEIRRTPLRMLDVFAGCGGLSEGLHQSGAAVSHWAIEQLTTAARAYQQNNTSCTVFADDCNKLLRSVLDGETHNASGQRLPSRGEVELLCGGPPCQGFSGMNRFNSREYSNFKNSLVASFLSYCDYYRPKYFIFENVRNFVAFKKGMVLKLTLRCLLQIGYQCTFGIVQAGDYGVPQTRRRLIIFASAPGYKLPEYPVPTHVFTRRACTLSVAIDGKRYNSNLILYNSAPKRTCTIRDAMSDLPEISNGTTKMEIDYGSEPQSDFQRSVRNKDPSVKLRDHICKNMAPLIQARMCRIPTTPGSDWRDLPNIAVTLSDGTKSKVLQYWYHDVKNGKGPGGTLRGVCACASGKTCNPLDKQDNTLIPWCLPHTGNRHNHWGGLYGRISWDGYFSTTVTDPEPMGKQGRILHPEQHRVVSVRECARSQGFPDSYIFVGNIPDKHRQIGNAVPPPLGAALGRVIKKALSISNKTT